MVDNFRNNIAREAQAKIVYNLKIYFLKPINHWDMTTSREDRDLKFYLNRTYSMLWWGIPEQLLQLLCSEQSLLIQLVKFSSQCNSSPPKVGDYICSDSMTSYPDLPYLLWLAGQPVQIENVKRSEISPTLTEEFCQYMASQSESFQFNKLNIVSVLCLYLFDNWRWIVSVGKWKKIKDVYLKKKMYYECNWLKLKTCHTNQLCSNKLLLSVQVLWIGSPPTHTTSKHLEMIYACLYSFFKHISLLSDKIALLCNTIYSSWSDKYAFL